jgi:unsaturated chondroitin disaccharide hydrolase
VDLRRAIPVLAAACLLAAACPAPAAADPVVRFAERQLARTDAKVRHGAYPNYTLRSGRWHLTPPEAWTSGFFPGAMWLLYRHTGDPAWRRRAARRQAPLAGQRRNTTTHDVGFIVGTSYGVAARMTRRRRYRRVGLAAAASLASRFNPVVGATRSWGRRGRRFTVIVDNLVNIQLLLWGARHGGPESWREIARRHALTAVRDHVRPDGSTFHVVDYDASTGRVLRKRTKQGAHADSTWSRGQAWAIHGFAAAYRHTRDRRLLRAARRVSRWWMAHVPRDRVPFWDFDAPGVLPRTGPKPATFSARRRRPARDSSAAAIAASGLLDLARVEPRRGSARRFRRAALATLRSLSSRRYLARGRRSRSILLHGTGHYARGNADSGLIFGDYYFLEALLRARVGR